MCYLKKLLIPLAAVFCAFLSAGCYTKIASFQNETMPTSASGSGCADCRDEAPVSDRREICVWERDIFGWPEMRCYTTNYASSWMYFHNTPWWYRNNYGWYDTRGCPAYYYYDRVSGICRYYGGSYYPPSNSGGSGNAANKPSVPRRSGRALPEESVPVQEAATSSSPMFTGSTRQLSPAGSPVSPVTAPPHNSNEGLAKPQETASQGQAQQPSQPPPQQQQPAEQQRKNDAPPPQQPPQRRSGRGI